MPARSKGSIFLVNHENDKFEFWIFLLSQGQIRVAKRRVVMASLYLGTGPLEQELVRFMWGMVLAAVVNGPQRATAFCAIELVWSCLSLASMSEPALIFVAPDVGMSGRAWCGEGLVRRAWGGLVWAFLASLAVSSYSHRVPGSSVCQFRAWLTVACRPNLTCHLLRCDL